MRYGMILEAGLFIFLTASTPAHPESLSIYQNGLETKDLDRLILENQPGPDEPLRALLLHKTDEESVHLVLIRTAEKPHIHRSHDGFVVLKRGEGTLHIGSETLHMKAGDTVFIPRGTVHYFKNTSDGIAAALAVFTPPYDGQDAVPVPGGTP
jgi:mannose-6-phosphate isomerase-like protein (cupin superfamily)